MAEDAPPPQPQPKIHQEKEHIPKPMASSTPGPGRSVGSCLAITLLIAGAIILTYWLIYRPHKPHFTVTNAAIYDLNPASAAPFLSTSMQFTIITRNPNQRVSIYYDKLTAYVSYKDQQITPPVELPPLFHETKSTVVLSPVLSGGAPVSPEVVNGLMMDEAYGVVPLRVVLVGRLRWKAGIIRTAKYAVYVKCDVWVGLKKGVVGQVPLLGAPPCKVDI